MEFENKVALVTGSGRGLGKAIAEKFLRQGAAVVLTDINEDTLKAASDELGALGEVSGVVMDVSRIESVQAAVETVIEKYGRSIYWSTTRASRRTG